MKIVIIGGTGRVGSTLVGALREHGHEAVPAAPNTDRRTEPFASPLPASDEQLAGPPAGHHR
jgi:uncharacterized protein YbjT (DUF2867 family)